MLNQLVKNNTEIRFQSTIIESDFVIFPEFQSYLEEIKNIEISNLFCSTRVQILDRSNNCFEINRILFYLFWRRIFPKGKRLLENIIQIILFF